MSDAEVLQSCEQFFQSCLPPEDLSEVKERVRHFVQEHHGKGRLIVLVTSGGTAVPLEKNTVRFIDNLSSGRRGSTSAEYFLDSDYAVIFLHRASSLQPFRRHFSSDNPLEWFVTTGEGDSTELEFSGTPALQKRISGILPSYQKCKREGTLLSIPYTTVFQYLFYLRELAQLLQPLDHRAMVYLAAAVSDFYIPHSQLSDHKIQSGDKLELDFSHTPKMVYPLTSQWAPKAFTVTFKLETDENVLLPHAKRNLLKYRNQIVVANLWASYRTTVTMVSPYALPRDDVCRCEEGVAGGGTGDEACPEWEALKLQLSREEIAKGTELEALIVSDLTVRHQKHINQQ